MIHTAAANATGYTDAGLTPETTYYYRVRAIGASQSDWSVEASVTTGMNPPSGLAITVASHQQLDVSWTDNTALEDNYVLERSTMACFCEPAHVVTVNANVTSYQDTGLTPETTYYYRVKATSAAGSSNWSAVVGAATPAEIISNPDLNFVGKTYFNGNISAVKWKTHGDGNEQGYAYTYDDLNRIKTASHVHKGSENWNTADAHFNVGMLDYDRNGNILSLKRQAKGDNGAYVIDELTYGYEDGNVSNRLLYVGDASGKTEGFKDGNTTQDDYGYDDNGNMTSDKNKDITSIEYNILNLPKRIVFGNGNEILYTYDAAGTKLRKEVKETVEGVLKRTVTDYMAGIQYTIDDYQGTEEAVTRDFLATGEGRVVMKETATEASQHEYQYNLTDHLGNVRVTFTTKDQPADVYTATMEDSEQTQEEADFGDSYTNAVKITSTIYNHTDPVAVPGADKAIRLSGAQNEIVGLAKSLVVNRGDTIDMEVYAKYIDPGQNPNASDVVGFFASAFTGAFGLSNGPEGDPATYNFFNDLFSTGPIALPGNANAGIPKGYLNFLLFDKNYNLVEAGFEQISAAAFEDGSNTAHEKLSSQVIAPKEGYLYIYVSNENETLADVYFDDLKITHKKSPIVSADDYYPFGLTFNSAKQIGGVDQRYKFQGQEHQDDFGLGLVQFKWRMHDPAIGRFIQVDPLTEDYTQWGPYVFSGNVVINAIELEGLEPVPILLGRPTPIVRPVSVPRVVPRVSPRIAPRNTPKASTQEHHVIPRALKNTKTVQRAIKEGFKFEGKENKTPLEKFSRKTGEGRHGNHPKYNKEVNRRISQFEESQGNNPGGAESLKFLRNTAKDLLRIIKENPDVKINDLFKQLNLTPSDATNIQIDRSLSNEEIEKNRQNAKQRKQHEEQQRKQEEQLRQLLEECPNCS
ncbi:RHS repeat-associated core domain-containing protein [Fulvivirgaceae bacterium BMA10]|uniref:RHS repeat-associated core domain-containing protein n=1 Tax=Splendidivirga corallicola TaxID=3051826 RepID=A0ABT8KWT2_9BACT|nr:RHS repeat-associated core domain-containing protein [Fulvivirgaceae bacterium BMA10]